MASLKKTGNIRLNARPVEIKENSVILFVSE